MQTYDGTRVTNDALHPTTLLDETPVVSSLLSLMGSLESPLFFHEKAEVLVRESGLGIGPGAPVPCNGQANEGTSLVG